MLPESIAKQKQEFDLLQGVEDYLRYLYGVSWLHDPFATQPDHSYNPEEEPDSIVNRGYEVMREASQKIIRNAHGVTNLAASYGQLELAKPNLREIVATAFHDTNTLERIDALLPDDQSLSKMQPAPFLTNPAHDYLAKGRSADKLTVGMLLAGVGIHKTLEISAAGPNFNSEQPSSFH